jgi:peroxiredoxin
MSRHLEPGMTIPDFQLPDENGEMHRLSELQGDDMLVLHSPAASTARASASTTASCCASTSGARSPSPSS